MDYKLDEMSLEELRALRAQVERTINDFAERKRREAMEAAEEAVKKHGFTSLADVTGARRGRSGARGKTSRPTGEEPRYANPQDPSQTWSGRGRRPGWIQEALASGKTLDDFAR